MQSARVKTIRGGRGSAKSWTVATLLLLFAMKHKRRILCTREIQRSIRDSVKKLLEDMIVRYQWGAYFDIKRERIECTLTGSEFFFCGLIDANKIKSIEGVDYCWVEEAQTVSLESIELLEPTIRKAGSEIWYTFNPRHLTDPVYDRHITNRRTGNIDVVANYTDNPWFGETSLVADMEWDRDNRPETYKHIWLGLPVVNTDKQVFNGCWKIAPVPTPPSDTKFWHGMDFGFSQDPVSLVRCWFAGRTLYVDREVRAYQLPLDQHDKFVRQIHTATTNRITADSSRPETINMLRRQGFDVVGCKKGAGSVEDGIDFLRSFDIVIDPNLTAVHDEFTHYSYKQDKHSGEILRTLEDRYNHTIDALRYAVEELMRARIGTVKKMKFHGL